MGNVASFNHFHKSFTLLRNIQFPQACACYLLKDLPVFACYLYYKPDPATYKIMMILVTREWFVFIAHSKWWLYLLSPQILIAWHIMSIDRWSVELILVYTKKIAVLRTPTCFSHKCPFPWTSFTQKFLLSKLQSSSQYFVEFSSLPRNCFWAEMFAESVPVAPILLNNNMFPIFHQMKQSLFGWTAVLRILVNDSRLQIWHGGWSKVKKKDKMLLNAG